MVLLSTGPATLTGFICFLNRAVQSHDGRIQIFISDPILELIKLSKFSKQESGRAHFLSLKAQVGAIQNEESGFVYDSHGL